MWFWWVTRPRMVWRSLSRWRQQQVGVGIPDHSVGDGNGREHRYADHLGHVPAIRPRPVSPSRTMQAGGGAISCRRAERDT